MRVPKVHLRTSSVSQADIPAAPRKEVWVAVALHLLGGSLLGLHRVYLERPAIVPYLIGWFALSFIALLALEEYGLYPMNALLVFLFADLLFIPAMVRRANRDAGHDVGS